MSKVIPKSLVRRIISHSLPGPEWSGFVSRTKMVKSKRVQESRSPKIDILPQAYKYLNNIIHIV